jgi:hypothetical protein
VDVARPEVDGRLPIAMESGEGQPFGVPAVGAGRVRRIRRALRGAGLRALSMARGMEADRRRDASKGAHINAAFDNVQAISTSGALAAMVGAK